jgi:17beta-estradiol 17-dehydrogenase / very-long-chain 3-oxoacyl-CoA reductase
MFGALVYTIGALTLLYLATHSLMLLRLYTRPSSLPRYLHGDSYALVTGSTDGIGLGYATELLSLGFNVILHGRNPKKLAIIRSNLLTQFPRRKIDTVVADAASSHPDIQGILHTIQHKPVTVLINNVGGIFTPAKFVGLTENSATDVDWNININARFQTQLTRAVLPLLERNAPSLIINMGSIASIGGLPLGSVYAAGKAYDMVFSNSLRLEMQLGGKDVEVLGVMVGEVNSGANRSGEGWFVLSSREMACAALDRVGCGVPWLFAAFPHLLFSWVLVILPQVVFDRIIIRVCQQRAEAERKRS